MASRGYRLDWHHSNDGSPGLKWWRYATLDSGDATTEVALPSYNEWHHVVIVSDGERQLVYLDGALKQSTEFSPTADVGEVGASIKLGNSGDADLFAQGGNVTYSEHSVVPYDLTAQEVGDLYAAGKGIYPAGSAFPGYVRDTLVAKAYYRMTERAGDVAIDDMASLDAAYAGDLALATTVGALRGGYQPGVRLYRSTAGPGRLVIADSSKMDFFDSLGDFSIAMFFRRDRQYRFGPMPISREPLGLTGTSLVFDLPDGDHENPKAQPGDLWLIVAAQTDTTYDVGASLVTNGFTSLWNATQTNYRTFGVYKWVTQADIDAHSSDVTTAGSVDVDGDMWLIRSARAIEAVHNNASADPSSINPTWAETEYLWRTYGGFDWGGVAPVANYYDAGSDVRTTSQTFDPSAITMAGAQPSSWTIAVRGFSDGAGDLGPAAYIFHRHDGVDGHLISYDPDNDQIVYSRDAGATVHTVTIDEPALDEWHMLVATFSGTSMALYLDGALATAKTGSNPQASTLNVGGLAVSTFIGNHSAVPGLELLTSDFSMYDYALSGTQISRMWELARGGMSGRGSLMLRWASGSRSGWQLPFALGDMDFGYVLPFDFEGTNNARAAVLEFILNGPAAAGPNGYRDLSLAMGPVGYWTVDESESQFLDSVGSVHGTVTGTFQRNVWPALVESPNSKMVEFDNATGAYIDFGDAHTFPGTAAFTWAGWLRDDGQDDTAAIVVKHDGVSNGYRIFIDVADYLWFEREDSLDVSVVNSLTALSGIHHIAATFDGTDMRLYIDGLLNDEATSVESIATHSTSLKLGGDTTEALNAAMDEWGVWDRALSADEVWTLSQARTNPEKADSGFILPFDLDGPVSSEVELPFSLLDATTGVLDGVILAPIVGWRDPTTSRALSFLETARSTVGALGLWMFDEATTVSGAADHLEGVTLSYEGSPTPGQPGALRDSPATAVRLDGASQSIRYASSAFGDYLHPGDTLSLMLFFQRDGLGAEELWCAGAGGLEVGFDGSDQLYAAKQGSGNFFSTTQTVTDSKWHMLVVTKDGPARAMYLDGVALANSTGDQTLTDTTGDIYIGRHQPAASGYFDGAVQAAGLFSVALSPATVADLNTRARG